MPAQQTCLLCLIFFLLLMPYGSRAAQSPDTLVAAPATIELKTYLEKNQIPLNRSVQFHIQLSWIGDMSRYQILQLPQPQLSNLLLEGSGSANRLETLEGGRYRSIKTISYQLKPVEMGMAYIDGLEIKYLDTVTEEVGMLQSQRIQVKIVDPLPDDAGAGVKAVIYIVLLGIFVASVTYFLFLFFKKRRRPSDSEAKDIPLAEVYLNKLSEEVDPKGANLAEMTLKMSRIFREYLSQAFEVPITESDPGAIVRRLRVAGIDASELQKLEELFQQLEVVKFAGGRIDPPEFSHLYGIVENFLTAQKKATEAANA